MATTLGVEFAKALLDRATRALSDPTLPSYMVRHWRSEKNRALTALAEHRASEEKSKAVTVFHFRL